MGHFINHTHPSPHTHLTIRTLSASVCYKKITVLLETVPHVGVEPKCNSGRGVPYMLCVVLFVVLNEDFDTGSDSAKLKRAKSSTTQDLQIKEAKSSKFPVVRSPCKVNGICLKLSVASSFFVITASKVH